MISITIRLDHSKKKKKSGTISMSSYTEFMADQDNQEDEEEGKSYEPLGMWAFQDEEDESYGRISNPRHLHVMDSRKSY